MAERIYTRDQQGRLEPLEGERFGKEDELQALIAEHPELLDGTQVRPDDPRRWILISLRRSARGRGPDACRRGPGAGAQAQPLAPAQASGESHRRAAGNGLQSWCVATCARFAPGMQPHGRLIQDVEAASERSATPTLRERQRALSLAAAEPPNSVPPASLSSPTGTAVPTLRQSCEPEPSIAQVNTSIIDPQPAPCQGVHVRFVRCCLMQQRFVVPRSLRSGR